MFKQTSTVKRCIAATTLAMLCVVSGGPLYASTIQSVAQSYSSTTSLQAGLIVEVSNKQATQVSEVSYASASKMLGVTVAAAAAPVTITTTTQTGGNQVYVATSGRYDVDVSNQDGVINVGDYITVSSLTGVGMKASASQTEVLGRAAGAFDGQHDVSGTTTLRDQTGRKVSVAIGRIPVDIAVGNNPLVSKDGSYVPSLLQKTVGIVTSKPVSSWRIYGSVIVVLAAVLVGASLIYGGTKSSMIAIGRNPLARSSIMQNLVQIIVTAIVVIAIGLFLSYVLLKV